jgi:pyroglutamyl-peptidase
MSSPIVLVTGYEPYGGRGINPAYEVMKVLDGRSVESATVVGGSLPVSLDGMKTKLNALIDQAHPSAVICLGLWPGEPMIRLERIGVNVADFEIPDNEGVFLRDTPLSKGFTTAYWSTLPLRVIEAQLLKAGIPARVSSTAGTFLCNACLFTLMEGLAARGLNVPAGFIHVPYTPEQVATLLSDLRACGALELHQRADLASMELSRIVQAIEIAIAEAVKCLQPS